MRLLRAAGEEAGQATRFLELDAGLLEPDARPLLGLLAPPYLAEGEFAELLGEARDYGAELRQRVDRRSARTSSRSSGASSAAGRRPMAATSPTTSCARELEAAGLTFVFRALFLLYAESAGYLPMRTPPTSSAA